MCNNKYLAILIELELIGITMYKKTFRELLAHYMKEAGVIQQQIASDSGVKQAYVSAILRDINKPPKFHTLKIFASTLNIKSHVKLHEFYLAAFLERASADDKAYIEELRQLALEINNGRQTDYLEPQTKGATVDKVRMSNKNIDTEAIDYLTQPHIAQTLNKFTKASPELRDHIIGYMRDLLDVLEKGNKQV